MEENKHNTRTSLLLTIVEKGKDNKVREYLKNQKVTFSVLLYAYGTASSSLLDYFGLDETRKSLILSVIPQHIEAQILYDFQEQLRFHEPGEGVACTISMTSASRYLCNINSNNKKKVGIIMKQEKQYELIMLIVSEGYATLAMDAAKKVGAMGGTLIHGRGLGTKEATKFLNITIEPEKDIVLIIAEKDMKQKIMQEITEKVGLSKEGRGVLFSCPVDKAVGLTERVEFEEVEK